MNTVNKQELKVTVSRLPEFVIEEMENYFESVFDEHELDCDHLQTLRMLVIGYDAAWDAAQSDLEWKSIADAAAGAIEQVQEDIQRLQAALERARNTMEDALSVGDARYRDFDIQFCPWADLHTGVEEINQALSTTTEPTGPSKSSMGLMLDKEDTNE